MESDAHYILTHPHTLKLRESNNLWFCDLSVQLNGCLSGSSSTNSQNGGARYVCTVAHCPFAVCLKCYEHYKCSKAEMPILKPKFISTIHKHELTENEGASWTCDGRKYYEGFNIPHEDGKNKLRYSCRKCDFDLCPKCFLCSYDPRNHISRILILRAEKEKKKSAMQNLMVAETYQVLKETGEDDVDALKERIKFLEAENHSLKEELANIKALIFEIQEELTDFQKELSGEMKDILIKYAGNALGVFNMIGGAISSLGDVLTIIPGVGQIVGALKMVYNVCAAPASAIKSKIKADKIKKTLDKLEALKGKLNSIH